MAQDSLGIIAFGAFFAIVESLHISNQTKGERTNQISPPLPAYIPGTWVVMGPDYEDYKRGHQVVKLFPEDKQIPGKRVWHDAVSDELPAFDPRYPANYPEIFVNASHNDPLRMCAPDGQDKGHYIYNVWTPELLIYSLDPKWDEPNSGRTDAAVIIAPGGGSLHLDWETEGISPAEWLNSVGITAFVLKYRVPDKERDLMAIDAQRAISLVRHLAPKYGVNRNRIGFWGSSAGALHAIKACKAKERVYQNIDEIDEQPWNIDFMILLYPMVPVYEPVSNPDFPPTVVGYSQDDPCCDPYRTNNFVANFYTRWKGEEELPIVAKNYIRGGHGWSDCYYYPFLLEIGATVCSFKSNYVRPFLENVLGRELPDPNTERLPISAMIPENGWQEVGSESPNIDLV